VGLRRRHRLALRPALLLALALATSPASAMTQGGGVPSVPDRERARLVGIYVGGPAVAGLSTKWRLTVHEEGGRLFARAGPVDRPPPAPSVLVPVGEGVFSPGGWRGGRLVHVRRDVRIVFHGGGDRAESVEFSYGRWPAFHFIRQPPPGLARPVALESPADPGGRHPARKSLRSRSAPS
jgi:hypothetical protein